jgi:hypothetical protein
MNEPTWILLPTLELQTDPIVWREWPDGKQESRLVSAFTLDDPDYANTMKLVEDNKLTIAPAEEPKANTGN